MASRAGSSQTHADRILAELLNQPDGASDAQLAKILSVEHRTVNANCRKMVARGLVAREDCNGTIINRALVSELPVRADIRATNGSWFWEGEVQQTVADFLVEEGWTIVSMVDTASRQPGTDIVLERAGIPLWVTVKGLPAGTAKTQPSTQARHYFAGALLDIVLWRHEAPLNAELAVALPIFPTYQNLATRTRWLQEAASFDFLWVNEAGEVRREPSRPSAM
jgi:hypothetical protein